MLETRIDEFLVDHLLRRISKAHGGKIAFEFCEYLPQRKYQEQVQSLHVVPASATPSWLDSKLSRLRVGFELALSSRVYSSETNGRVLIGHIPMLDLKGSHTTGIPDIEIALREEHPEIGKLYWCSSGRSFHVYGDGLVSPQVWPRFLGTMLLLPAADGVLQPDKRWVGHRLRDGFCSLRISNNSGRFKTVPHVLSRPSLRVLPGLVRQALTDTPQTSH
jgi:hypothetical protein